MLYELPQVPDKYVDNLTQQCIHQIAGQKTRHNSRVYKKNNPESVKYMLKLS